MLIVGDSLTVGSADALRAAVPHARVDARVGRGSAEGASLVGPLLHKGDRALGFLLGTNDWSAEQLFANMERARRRARGRCVVVATLTRGPGGAVWRFALKHPNTVVVAPWRRWALGHPERMAPDGVHADARGYAERAKLIAEAAARCPSTRPGAR